eukprot:g1641.t1
MSAGSRLKPRAAAAAEPLPQEIPTIGSMREPLVVDYLRLVREPDWRGLRNECVVVGKKLILELQRKGFEPLEVLALAFQWHGVVLLGGCGDAFGPVCLRSSQGALWSLPWMRLKDGYKFEQMAAQLRDERKFALFALHDADAGGNTPLLNARELLRSGAQREKMPAGATMGEEEIEEAAEGALESHSPGHEDAEKSSPTTSKGSEGEERTPLPSAVYRLGRKSLDSTRQRGVLLLIRGDDVIRNTKPSKTFTRIATSGLVPSVPVPVSVRASALLYQIRTRLLRGASQTGMVA